MLTHHACAGRPGHGVIVMITCICISVLDVVDFEVLLNSDSNITVEAGSNQSFICSSSSKVSMWQWLFNDGLDLPNGVEVFDLSSNRTMLFICDVQSFHVGEYKCEGTSVDGIDIDSDVTTIHRGQ